MRLRVRRGTRSIGKRFLAGASACLLLIAAASTARAQTQAQPQPPTLSPFRAGEDQMALILDRARVAAGLLPLARSASLDLAAGAHAQDMAALGYMEHEGMDGSTPASRAADAGYQTPRGSAWLVVEVISARGDPAEHALDWWLSDGLHRRVVLRSTWREMGIGFAPGGPYGRFWVVLFGCRPNVLPPVVLDGMLSIPDENCGAAPDTFGRVDAVRAADTSARLDSATWEPYSSQREWPEGSSAVVQLRDTSGRVLEAKASDPTTSLPDPAPASP
jgi:uncharacterized protein YkwD